MESLAIASQHGYQTLSLFSTKKGNLEEDNAPDLMLGPCHSVTRTVNGRVGLH